MTDKNGTGTGDGTHGGGMDETRDRVREEINNQKAQQGRFSDSAAARAMGTSPAVFSQWMAGKYTGDNAAVEEKALRWLRSLEERRLHESDIPEEPGFVDTPTSRRVHSTLVYAHTFSDLVVIHGAAGVGKTKTSVRYQQAHPNVWIATMTSACKGPGSVLVEIADEFGIQANWSNPHSVWREVVKYLKGREGLLIIDEAQQLAVEGLEIVRQLHDKTGIGLAIIGNEGVYARMTGGTRQAKYAQIFGRIGKPCSIKHSTADDAREIARAWGVDGKAEHRTVHEIARKPGGIRVVTKTLRMAWMIAGQRGGSVDDTTIRQAYSELTAGVTA